MKYEKFDLEDSKKNKKEEILEMQAFMYGNCLS